jgi:hypothetical protein
VYIVMEECRGGDLEQLMDVRVMLNHLPSSQTRCSPHLRVYSCAAVHFMWPGSLKSAPCASCLY